MASVRSTTFLFDPGSIKYFQILDQDGCTDTRKNQPNRYWPTAVNPVSERTYLDPGNVTFTGGPTELVVPRYQMPWPDPLDRSIPRVRRTCDSETHRERCRDVHVREDQL